LENLNIGAYLRRDKQAIQKDIAWLYGVFPRLQERAQQASGTQGSASDRSSLASL
jgi:branched-chain amino acid transport system ATP-binding protein